MKTIEIVVPYYNESENMHPLYEAIKGVSAEKLPAYSYMLLFANGDNSGDLLVILKKLSGGDRRVKCSPFSCNFGHRLVVKAGLNHSFADAVISMDYGQQHPPVLTLELVKCWEEGNQVVTMLRTYPPDTPKKKRKSSHRFYKLLNTLSDIKVKEGSADSRLLDQGVVGVIREMNENEPFLRGTMPWVGFKQCYMPYTA